MYFVLEGQLEIIIPKPEADIVEDKKKFDARRRQMIIEEKTDFNVPNFEDTIIEASKILPRKIIENMLKLNETQLDESLRLMICNIQNFHRITKKDLYLLGINNLNRYYSNKAFTYKFITPKKKNDFFGELALMNNNARAATVLSVTESH